MDIVHKVEETLVPNVVDEEIAATIHIHHTLIPTRRPIQWEEVQVLEVVALPEVQSLAGHKKVRQFIIHQLKYRLSHPSETQ
jgi:hypothetical protein